MTYSFRKSIAAEELKGGPIIPLIKRKLILRKKLIGQYVSSVRSSFLGKSPIWMSKMFCFLNLYPKYTLSGRCHWCSSVHGIQSLSEYRANQTKLQKYMTVKKVIS